MSKNLRPMACTRFVRRHMRRLREDSSGAAIVEFVLIAPAALALLGIICVLGQGMEILGKASLTARTVTTLVTTQGATISQANLNCILNAAGAVMSPWGTSQLSVVVSEVYVTSSTTGKIIWSSATYQGSPRPVGANVTLASGAFVTGTYQILGEVSYVYTPLGFSNDSFVSDTLSQSIFLMPRSGSAIAVTS